MEQSLRNKKGFSRFFLALLPSWDTIKVRLHCRHASIALG